MNNLNKSILGIVRSRNNNNPETLKIIDYEIDEENQEIYLIFLYKNLRYKAKIENIITNNYDIPVNFGERYIIVDGHIYFIDDIEDIAGIFQ